MITLTTDQSAITSKILETVFGTNYDTTEIVGLRVYETAVEIITTTGGIWSMGRGYFRQLVTQFKAAATQAKRQVKATIQLSDPMTCTLEVGDIVEVVSHRHPAHHGLVGTVEAIANFSELSFQVKTPCGTKGYERGDLKIISSKAQKPQQQPTGLQAGTVLMGNRVVTTGKYAGQARRNSLSMARMGTANKVAALELMKAGMSREEAMASVFGAGC